MPTPKTATICGQWFLGSTYEKDSVRAVHRLGTISDKLLANDYYLNLLGRITAKQWKRAALRATEDVA